MIQPMYETLQSYGNINIPLSDEFDLNKLKSVLSTSDEPLTTMTLPQSKTVICDLRRIFYINTKAANYWAQMMSAELHGG
ncbi:MAG: hypothetical protein ACLR6O_00770 [Eubacterium sp.]